MKRLIGVVLCLVLCCSWLVGCSEGEPIVWEDIILGTQLPKPTLEKGEIHTNTEERLWMYLNNAEKTDYSSYLAQCKETFNIDTTIIGDLYIAYNSSGYKINIDHNEYDEYISISLDAPLQTKNLIWPFHDYCEMLPTPKSTKGKIEWEYDDHFLLYLSDMTIDDYADYVDACSDAGFDVDYDKGKTYYRAKNGDEYALSVSYVGFNVISIKLEAPKEEEESTTASREDEPESKESESNESSDGNEDFKNAMDEYEEFMDEYVAFMKKYNESDGTDLSLLSDYTQYLSDYADMLDAFEKWEEEELSNDELAYYVEVQQRVTKKLLEIGE